MGRREVFDPARAFVANRAFVWAGKQILGGQPFADKSNTRRLRQLYDTRYLKMLPPGDEPEEENDGRPIFAMMEEQHIRDWMRERNVIAHPRSDYKTLVRKATLLWLELKDGKVRPSKPTGEDNGLSASGDQQSHTQGDRQGVQEPVGEGNPPKRIRLKR